MYSHILRSFVIVIALATGLWTINAQPAPYTPMKAEDPELWFAFLQAQGTINQQIQAVSAASPTRGAQLTSSTAATYHISVSDLPPLSASVGAALAALSHWRANAATYTSQLTASHQPPNLDQLRDLQAQRRRLIITGFDSIRASISASSWSGLYAYVTGVFAQNRRP